MTNFGYVLLTFLLCWGALLLRVGLGLFGHLVPAVGLALTVLVARRGAPGRFRVVALTAGLTAGAGVEEGLIVPVLALLILGAVAASSRLVLKFESGMGLGIMGCLFALAYAGLLLAFHDDGPLTTLGTEGMPFALGGLVLSGALVAFLDAAAAAAPSLRHALERP